jgi:hypothetical protein
MGSTISAEATIDKSFKNNIGRALSRAILVKKKVSIPPRPVKVIKKNPDDLAWLTEVIKWIDEKCLNNIPLINIDQSVFYFHVHPTLTQLKSKCPLECQALSGLVWAVKSDFDRWLVEIKNHGGNIHVESTTIGTTLDYYPELITRYNVLDLNQI